MKSLLVALLFAFGIPAARAEIFGIAVEATVPNGKLEALSEITQSAFPYPDFEKARLRSMGGWNVGDVMFFITALEPRTEADNAYVREYVAQHPGFEYENLKGRFEKIDAVLSSSQLRVATPGGGEPIRFANIVGYPSWQALSKVCDEIETIFAKNKDGFEELKSFGPAVFGSVDFATVKYLVGKSRVERLTFDNSVIAYQFADGRVASSRMTCAPAEMDLTARARKAVNGRLRFVSPSGRHFSRGND